MAAGATTTEKSIWGLRTDQISRGVLLILDKLKADAASALTHPDEYMHLVNTFINYTMIE